MTKPTKRTSELVDGHTAVSAGEADRRRLEIARVLSTGSVLGRSFSVWRSDAWKFATIFVVMNLPILLVGVWIFSSLESWNDNKIWWLCVAALGSMLLEQIAIGATVHGVFQRLVGRPAKVGACLSTGASRLRSLFGIALRVSLYEILLTVGLQLLVESLLNLVLPTKSNPAVTEAADIVLTVAANLVVKYLFWTAAPACVAERKSSGDSMRRARELQRGNQGPIFGAIAILLGAQLTFSLVFTYQFGGMSPAAVLEGPQRARAAFEAALMSTLILQGVELLIFSPLLAVAAAVAYHDLRQGKEGVDTAQLIRIFE